MADEDVTRMSKGVGCRGSVRVSVSPFPSPLWFVCSGIEISRKPITEEPKKQCHVLSSMMELKFLHFSTFLWGWLKSNILILRHTRAHVQVQLHAKQHTTTWPVTTHRKNTQRGMSWPSSPFLPSTFEKNFNFTIFTMMARIARMELCNDH
jgi:hypothetical protein